MNSTNLPAFTAGSVLQLIIISEELAAVKIERMRPQERARLIREYTKEIQALSDYLLSKGVNPAKYIK